jgi:hypothetical protein
MPSLTGGSWYPHRSPKTRAPSNSAYRLQPITISVMAVTDRSQAMLENMWAFSPPPSPPSQISPPRGGLYFYSRDANLSGQRMALGTRLAETFDCLDSPAGAEASACSTLPVVFAIHSRRLGEHYNGHSLGCEFSDGSIGNKFGLSNSPPTSPRLGHPGEDEILMRERKCVQALFLCAVPHLGEPTLFNKPMRPTWTSVW